MGRGASAPSPCRTATAGTLPATLQLPLSGPRRCPVCASSAFQSLFLTPARSGRDAGAGSRAVECATCGLIRLEPCPTAEELDRLDPDSKTRDPASIQTSKVTEYLTSLSCRGHLRFIERSVRAADSVLDASCDGGHLAAALRRRGIPVQATGAPSVSAVGWDKLPAQLRADCGGVPVSTLPAGAFGAVTACHLLHRVPQPRTVLLELRRLLRVGGSLVVQVPNARSWQALLCGGRWSGLDVPRCPVGFSLPQIERLLETCGFKVLRRKMFTLRDNPCGLVTTLFPWLDPKVRRRRKVRESNGIAAFKDALYAALAASALPATLAEAASGAGATLLIEARRVGDATESEGRSPR